MSNAIESDILYLPHEDEFQEAIVEAALLFNPDVFHSSDRALVQDALSGLFRPVNRLELIDYIEGGEWDEVSSNELAYGS
jgi:hypothetical protein